MSNKLLDSYIQGMAKLREKLSGIPDSAPQRKLESVMSTVNMCLRTFESEIESSLVPGSKPLDHVNAMKRNLSLLLQANGITKKHFTIGRDIPDFKRVAKSELYSRYAIIGRNDNDPDAVEIFAYGTISPRGFVYVQIHVFAAEYKKSR